MGQSELPVVSSGLHLKIDKTKLLRCATARHRTQLPQTLIPVGSCPVSPTSCVCDLGIYVGADISGRTHVAKIISTCFSALHWLLSIRCSIDRLYKTLVVSLVLNRLDSTMTTQCYAVSLTIQCIIGFSRSLNAAARSIFLLRRSEYVSPALAELHSLRAADRLKVVLGP